MAQPQSALRALDQSYLMGIGQGPAPARVPRTRGQTAADMLGAAAIGTTPIPIVGEITGLAADAAMYAAYPEERTLGNAAMTALGAFPFVPNAASYRLAQKGLDIIKVPSGEKYADGAEYFLNAPDGKPAGYMAVQPDIKSNRMKSSDSEIYPQYRGQGVASDMYDAIQVMENKDFYPSEVLTNDGARFWASRDPELIRNLLSQGYFAGEVQDNVQRALSPMAGVLPLVPGVAAVRAARGASPLEGTLDISKRRPD